MSTSALCPATLLPASKNCTLYFLTCKYCGQTASHTHHPYHSPDWGTCNATCPFCERIYARNHDMIAYHLCRTCWSCNSTEPLVDYWGEFMEACIKCRQKLDGSHVLEWRIKTVFVEGDAVWKPDDVGPVDVGEEERRWKRKNGEVRRTWEIPMEARLEYRAPSEQTRREEDAKRELSILSSGVEREEVSKRTGKEDRQADNEQEDGKYGNFEEGVGENQHGIVESSLDDLMDGILGIGLRVWMRLGPRLLQD